MVAEPLAQRRTARPFRLATAVALALVATGCGGDKTCPEPNLVVTPTSIPSDGEITVVADPPLKRCFDERADQFISHLPINTVVATLDLAPARAVDDGKFQISGDTITLANVPFDNEVGEINVTTSLPDEVTSGDWVVFIRQNSEFRAGFRIEF